MFIDSTTNWNWLLEKSKKKIKNNNNKKFIVVTNKAITLSLYLILCDIKGLHKRIKTPNNGINNNENNIINIYIYKLTYVLTLDNAYSV